MSTPRSPGQTVSRWGGGRVHPRVGRRVLSRYRPVLLVRAVRMHGRAGGRMVVRYRGGLRLSQSCPVDLVPEVGHNLLGLFIRVVS